MDPDVERDADVLADPAAFEAGARRLAELLRPRAPDVVLSWQAPADTVLAHVVARELGAASLRCVDRDGLAAFTSGTQTGGRVVVVGLDLDRADHVRAMLALAEQRGLEVVGAGALRDVGGAIDEVLTVHGVALVRVEGEGPGHG